MALVLKDRVKETTTVTSTGTATLLGAVAGYQSFSVIGNGNTCYYTIAAQTSSDWEVGIGTYTSPDQLSRDTVLSSSNSGSSVNFSAGTKDVFVTQPSSKAVYTDASNIINTSGNAATTVTFTQVNTTNLVASTVTLTAGTISTNAANATDITNKAYVDGLVTSGIHFHEPVLVEEDIALDAVYVQPNGASNGVGATLTNNAANAALVVDGVSVSNTARILVYAQANAVQNGVYTVTNPGNASAQWVLTRATDADTFGLTSPDNLGEGSTFFVSSGNTGAGRTYTCNTTGTITFGTTDITFAQISSSQIYSAGTGLNLSNLVFSISNTTVTAATYGDSGNVAQVTVNAQGQLTNAANVAINASSITVGTLANGRTTAASANGASTIVLRDSNGSFNANVGTFTTVNATNGNFTNITGNAVALTAINASNVTSGTLDNARTTGNTANSASTIVLRDASGNFGSNVISASLFSGDGSGINAINASNISSGTIANARTTAASANGASTIVQRDSGGSFTANTGTFTSVSGNGVALTAINASNIASGTIANARTTASSSNGASTIVLRGASGEFAAGAITGTSFSGNGSALTAINASAITTGTLDNARTTAASANGASTIVVRDANGSFAGNVITGTTGTFTSVSGNGVALTAINASNISSGTIANARTTAASANGASTIVARDANGSFTANVVTGTTGTFTSVSGNGVALTAINASNISSGTIANARTTASDANGASTIVSRDANGSFTANIITANGSAISAINGSNVTTGTVANARTTAASANGASTIVVRDANGSFAGNVITGTTGTFTSVSGNGVALTAINASNISSGTIANARTTAASANGASTIVARDSNGSFTANVGTFTSVSGNGVALTAINASNISSGTIANARTTAASANGASTIVSRDANGSFTANVGTFTSVSGNGVALTAINASNISSGTIANARTTGNTANSASTLVLRDASGNFASNEISGQEMIATNGLFVNSLTISSSYSIPANSSAVSVGPITLANGVSVTVPSGGRWVVL
jgi:hypothetical protein